MVARCCATVPTVAACAFDEAAIDWLLTHAERDVPGLVALLDRLDRASLAEQRRITVPFLKQVLAAQA